MHGFGTESAMAITIMRSVLRRNEDCNNFMLKSEIISLLQTPISLISYHCIPSRDTIHCDPLIQLVLLLKEGLLEPDLLDFRPPHEQTSWRSTLLLMPFIETPKELQLAFAHISATCPWTSVRAFVLETFFDLKSPSFQRELIYTIDELEPIHKTIEMTDTGVEADNSHYNEEMSKLIIQCSSLEIEIHSKCEEIRQLLLKNSALALSQESTERRLSELQENLESSKDFNRSMKVELDMLNDIILENLDTNSFLQSKYSNSKAEFESRLVQSRTNEILVHQRYTELEATLADLKHARINLVAKCSELEQRLQQRERDAQVAEFGILSSSFNLIVDLRAQQDRWRIESIEWRQRIIEIEASNRSQQQEIELLRGRLEQSTQQNIVDRNKISDLEQTLRSKDLQIEMLKIEITNGNNIPLRPIEESRHMLMPKDEIALVLADMIVD